MADTAVLFQEEFGASPVGDIVDGLALLADRNVLKVGDIVESFGAASFVPLMMVPAILVVSPLSGIPLLSSICGLSIGLVAGQMVLGRRHVWLPDRIVRQEVLGRRVRPALTRVRHVTEWVDHRARGRLRVLVSRPIDKLTQFLAVICGFAMPFLEFVPFSSSILGLAVLMFSTAFLTRDGLFALGGLSLMVVASLIPGAVLLAAT